MKQRIEKIFFDCGIKDIGFCSFSVIEEALLECRAKSRIPKNAKTIILCLFPYKVKKEKPENISRYAAVPDYHRICIEYLNKAKEKLSAEFNDNAFEVFIDNSPIPEVRAAATAGLGLIGENHLLINEKYGSWCFIGEIVTDLEIDTKNQLKKCSVCGVCKNVCPRGVHGGKCLSSLSQQKKDLSDEERELLKKNKIVWGCDICAEVCPLNIETQKTYISEFIAGYRNSYSPDEDIEGRAYEWRGEAVVKRNYNNLNINKGH